MNKVGIAILLGICIAIVWIAFEANELCKDQGGVYARTLVGYECIGAKP